MAPDVTAIERLQERPIGVDPHAIEDEFARVWRETSGAGYDESSVRLRVLNLVGVGAGSDVERQFEQVMQVLPERHPCRGILALIDTSAAGIDAAISAYCLRAPGGELDVCSEEVTLIGAPERQQELSSVVLALLVPEIPVAVWLIGNVDVRAYLTTETIEAADTVLFDSARIAQLAEAYRCGLEIEDELDARVFDLAWGRTEPWRALIAQLFDGDDRVGELDRLQEVEIRGGAGARSSEAMLLAGWLVSRLGLSLADLDGNGDVIRATLYARTRGVRLTISREGDEPLVLVRIKTANASFVLQRNAGVGHLEVSERWPEGEMQRTVDIPNTDDAAVILLGLNATQEHRIYRDAAATVMALLGQ